MGPIVKFVVVIMISGPRLTQITYDSPRQLCKALDQDLKEATETIAAVREWAYEALIGDWYDFPAGWIFVVRGDATGGEVEIEDDTVPNRLKH